MGPVVFYCPVRSDAHLEKSYGGADSITDRLHRSNDEKLWGGTLNNNQANTTYYQYNGVDRLAGLYTDATSGTNLKREMFSTSGQYPSFDRFGRTVTQTWKNRTSGNVLDQFTYTYDYAGNRTLRAWAGSGTGGNQDFAYDGLHRLRQFRKGSPGSGGYVSSINYQENWTLDPLGNWSEFKIDIDGNGTFTGTSDLTQQRYFNAANEFYGSGGGSITAYGGQADWADPQQDAAGNTTTIPKPASLTTSYTLTYDAWNRLVKVADGGTTVVTYEYDGLGHRIVKDVAGGTTNDREYYYNDKWQLLTETKPSGVEAIYQWHPFYVDALAVRMRASDTHFFLHDVNYNVTAAVLDSTDAVVERYNYTAYGVPTFLNASFGGISSSAIGNAHLYTGRERDSESGLQLNRHRYYASHLGRWLTRDPIGYEGSSKNLYQYIGGRVNDRVDPSGLEQARYCQGILCLALFGQKKCCVAYDARDVGNAAAAGLPGQQDGLGDAVRHCAGMCHLVRNGLSANEARAIGNIHEFCVPNTPGATCMDKGNNEVGIEIGIRTSGECRDECRKAASSGKLITSPCP